MAKKENILITIEELREKYGDAKVMVVPKELVEPVLNKKNPYTLNSDLYITEEKKENTVKVPLVVAINRNLSPMLRCEAELDPSFKQVIPYVVLINDGKVFCTHRLKGGDKRLAGAYSIGTGGHIDEGETVYDGMWRELKEEVGVTVDNSMGYKVMGFIYDNSSSVNSVHLGILVGMHINSDKIHCLETEKLAGEWMNIQQLKKLKDEGKLESWSEIAFTNLWGAQDAEG